MRWNRSKDGDFTKHLHDIDILVLRSHVGVTTADINRAGRLSLIIKAGSGFDNIDVNAARNRGIVVDSTPAASRSVADHAVALLLCGWRRLPLFSSELRAGNWGSNTRNWLGILKDTRSVYLASAR